MGGWLSSKGSLGMQPHPVCTQQLSLEGTGLVCQSWGVGLDFSKPTLISIL